MFSLTPRTPIAVSEKSSQSISPPDTKALCDYDDEKTLIRFEKIKRKAIDVIDLLPATKK